MRQATDYTCGVAALQSILVYWGEDVREDRLARALKADRHNGTAYKRIVDYARAKGYRVDYETGMTVDRLKSLLDRRRPVICLIQAWSEKPVDYTNDWSDGHYVVALGYDRDNFYFMDPSTAGHYTFIPISSFVRRWHDIDSKERLNHFGMAVSKPDAVPEASRVTAVE